MGKALKLAQLVNDISYGGILDEYMCATPNIIAVSSNEINERESIEITIDNYDENALYIANDPIVTKLYYVGVGKFKMYFGNVSSDTNYTVKIRAIKTGYISSKWSSDIVVTLKDLPDTEDDIITNNAFLTNKDTSTDCDVIESKITFTADNGKYYEKLTEQGDGEKAWTGYQTNVYIPLEDLKVDSNHTTKDSLMVTSSTISSASKCYIVNGDNTNGTEITLGDITDESIDLTGTLDIFNDSSCTACYPLDGDATDLGGNYSGTVNNLETIDAGKYGKALKATDDTGRVLISNCSDLKTKTITVSMWVKYDGSDDDNQILFGTWLAAEWAGFNILHEDANNLVLRGGTNDTKDSIDIVPDPKVPIPDDDDWHHIVAIHDQSNKKSKLYLDNNLIGSNNDTSEGVTYVNSDSDHIADDEIVLLGVKSENYYGSNGITMDHVRIFNKVLSEDEINTLYTDEHVTKYKADISSNELANAPEKAYAIEAPVEIKTALTNGIPTDDDFVKDTPESWKIQGGHKVITNERQQDYAGTRFKRMVTGLVNGTVDKLETQMWKEL